MYSAAIVLYVGEGLIPFDTIPGDPKLLCIALRILVLIVIGVTAKYGHVFVCVIGLTVLVRRGRGIVVSPSSHHARVIDLLPEAFVQPHG